jgi:hypothetical protein
VGRDIFVDRPTKILTLFSSVPRPTKIMRIFVGPSICSSAGRRKYKNVFSSVTRPTKITLIFVGRGQTDENTSLTVLYCRRPSEADENRGPTSSSSASLVSIARHSFHRTPPPHARPPLAAPPHVARRRATPPPRALREPAPPSPRPPSPRRATARRPPPAGARADAPRRRPAR